MKQKIDEYLLYFLSFISFSNIVLILAVAGSYFTSGRIGQILALPPGYVSPIWPASGIALAMVLLFGYRVLPGVFLGSFLNNLLLFPAGFTLHFSLLAYLSSFGIGVGATLEAFAGAYLVQHFTALAPFNTAYNVFKFILIAILSCTINSGIGLLSLSLAESINWEESWWTWWIGDTVGILLFTPFLIALYEEKIHKVSIAKVFEGMGIFLLILILVHLIFNSNIAFNYSFIPLLVWLGFRFGLLGVSSGVIVIAFLYILGTMQRMGPFYIADSLNSSLILLEFFFSLLNTMSLFLVAALKEREYAKQLLQDNNVHLENKVRERTHELEEELEKKKKMQEQIINQEKLASLGTLAAGVAHEIKNPLNFICNFSELSAELADQVTVELESQEKRMEPEKFKDIHEGLHLVQQNLQKIMDHARKANQTVQSMLLHAKDKPQQFALANLNTLVEDYCKLIYFSRKQKLPNFPVTIETHFDPAISEVLMNKQNISRVILNVLNNAFDSMEEKAEQDSNYTPHVIVSTKNETNYVNIIIEDNGVGISEAAKDKIFIPFYSEKPLREDSSGLGLSISYDIIVKEHNGQIDCESVKGQFARFTIRLPKTQ